MILHVFNPEHELCMAANSSYFTPPAHVCQLRSHLDFLPALWASEGDTVLVNNKNAALSSFKKANEQIYDLYKIRIDKKEIRFIETDCISTLPDTYEVDVWGWNKTIRTFLHKHGVAERLLPSDKTLDITRELSHRRQAGILMDNLRAPGIIGRHHICNNIEDISMLIEAYCNIIVKAPWSSSGRGLRRIERQPTDHQLGWVKNMLKTQGCVIVEPYYKKIKDFGMEFYSDGNGNISYQGLSLFHTANGAYIGNIIAPEEYKIKQITEFLPIKLLEQTKLQICQNAGRLYNNVYKGKFGIDMMIVSSDDNSFMLHPCVEINMRRTMGHLAIDILPEGYTSVGVMSINNYQLTIKHL